MVDVSCCKRSTMLRVEVEILWFFLQLRLCDTNRLVTVVTNGLCVCYSLRHCMSVHLAICLHSHHVAMFPGDYSDI